MEDLKRIKHCLTTKVLEQMSNLEAVNTKELGEAVDMIKDMAEAIYYCSVAKAMEESDERAEKMLTYHTKEASTTHATTPIVEK